MFPLGQTDIILSKQLVRLQTRLAALFCTRLASWPVLAGSKAHTCLTQLAARCAFLCSRALLAVSTYKLEASRLSLSGLTRFRI